MSELQEALPREHYVDASLHERERTTVLLSEWTCMGRLDDLGLTLPGTRDLLPERLAVVDLLGESVLVTTDAQGGLHAHYNVCRHRGSQVVPVEPGASVAPCAARSLRCPYHSWTYALDGTLLHAPHTDDVDMPAFALHPVGAIGPGAGTFETESDIRESRSVLTPGGVNVVAPCPSGRSGFISQLSSGALESGRTVTVPCAASYPTAASVSE